MKRILFFLFVCFFCSLSVEAQTNAGIPGPENVLVVYKAKENPQDTLGMISDSVMLYYKNGRNIPAVNIISPGLRFPDTTFTIDGVTHTVGLGQVTDNIRDFDNHNSGTWYATEHAWKYFYTFMAQPIKNYLTNHNLTNTIRYIVLCKGVPFKVQAGADSSGVLCNVTVDGLLCMLNTDNYESFLHTVYDSLRNRAIDKDHYYYEPIIPNPYSNADSDLWMNQRFLPDHFSEIWYADTIKLSYLVSHLDGVDLQTVYNIIDKSVDADTSSNRTWVLDDDNGASGFIYAKGVLEALGENVTYDNTNNWIITADRPVMGYCSYGTHSEDHNCDWHDSTYWVDLLNFQYANGAIATTYESFNGNSLTTLKWRHIDCVPPKCNHTQGLITQFTMKDLDGSGGSGFSGNAWEPGKVSVTSPDIYFPMYAAGYDQVDAAYMGTNNLAWQNVIEGDPLAKISNLIQVDTITGTLQTDLDNRKIIVPNGGELIIPTNTTINIDHYGGIQVLGKLIIGNGVTLNLFKHAIINVSNNGEIDFENNSKLYTNEHSSFISKGKVTCAYGVQIIDGSSITISNKIFVEGSVSMPVILSSNITFSDADSLIFNYVNFSNGTLNLANNDKHGVIDIENSNFSSIIIINFNKTNFSNDNIHSDPNTNGIELQNSGNTKIINCEFVNCSNGIYKDRSQNPLDSLIVKKCTFGINSPIHLIINGIYLDYVDNGLKYVEIDSSEFDNLNIAISLNGFKNCYSVISNNSISNYLSYAISLTNGSSVTIKNDTISTSSSYAVNPIGIYLSSVTNPTVLDNSITTDLSSPGSGVVSVSSDGNYRSNTITGYFNGVELGNSSPNMASNIIHDNLQNGMYISSGSNPKLGKTISGGLTYPLTGYNSIYENGSCSELLNNCEIYLNKANIQLSKGCNTIADDRLLNPPPCDDQILMDGVNVTDVIVADSNYWGNHPTWGHDPAGRFGSGLTVRYIPYDTEACYYGPPNNNMLLLTAITGQVVDTIYSTGSASGNLSTIENEYSSANQSFYSGDYSSAENIYKDIITDFTDSVGCIEAYNKLYLIKKYQNANAQDYTNLKQYYQSKLPSVQDSTILVAVNNLINLCEVSKQDYNQAISSFDEIAQNNQGTDVALYNEINAYTTALLLDSTNTMGKTGLKYTSKNLSEYLNNISSLLKSRGKSIENGKNILIPDKYYLYNNYPNPFNPTTTIKYDLPKAAIVTLKIYDILGREVKTLADHELKTPGSYKVVFDASNLASGVYFYRLQTNDYVNVKKMLLLK